MKQFVRKNKTLLLIIALILIFSNMKTGETQAVLGFDDIVENEWTLCTSDTCCDIDEFYMENDKFEFKCCKGLHKEQIQVKTQDLLQLANDVNIALPGGPIRTAFEWLISKLGVLLGGGSTVSIGYVCEDVPLGGNFCPDFIKDTFKVTCKSATWITIGLIGIGAILLLGAI